MNTLTAVHEASLGGRPAHALGTAPESHTHGVCWGAIFAGAVGAASLSLILLILGMGLGLSSVSPWSTEGVSAETFGVSTILWLTFTQLAASGMGGYLAGRLRARWVAVHPDEGHFRDTAHGFLAWSLATLVTAGLLSSAAGMIVSGGAKAGAAVAGTATTAVAAPAAAMTANSSGSGYFVDALFRKDLSPAAVAAAASAPGTDAGGPAPTAEAARIFANAAGSGTLPQGDVQYLAQVVAQRTGLSPVDAQRRVTDAFNQMEAKASAAKQDAQAAADKARKASAMASLWIFVSLLIGAFGASLTATLGGRQRDQQV